MRQLKFNFLNNYKNEFGGNLLTGKRKTARPLAVNSPMHLILKSSKLNPFNPTNYTLTKIIKAHARKYKIKIHDLAINHSHIPMVMKLPNREAYFAFIKTVSAALVNYLSKVLKKDLRGLFDLRPYTRILSWGRELKTVLEYMILNQQEALGLIKREKEKPNPKKLNLTPI